ncbi:MAG: hypothetical protein HC829_02485 [Bacteroidales bacterium]|nr:hypothetical protein [Bacteroidales bacterium]
MNHIITLPAEQIMAGDLIDRGLDKLRTCYLAIHPEKAGLLTDEALTAISVTLQDAICDLEPVRRLLQCGEDRP